MPVHGTALWLPKYEGLLLLGAAGSGKSSLAWHWIQQFGAELVSDDQVRLTATTDGWQMEAPETIRGLLMLAGELHRLPYRASARLRQVVSLDGTSADFGVPIVTFKDIERQLRSHPPGAGMME